MSPLRDSTLPIEAQFAQAGTDAERAWLLNEKAVEYEGDDPVQMLELARRAREFAAQCGDREAWAYSCRHAGIAHHLLAHTIEALADLEAALAEFEVQGNKQGVALVVGNLAVVFQDTGRFDLALDSQLRCIKLCDELGDEQGKARTLLNTAEIYCALQEEERALEFCEQSLAIATKWNDRHTMGTAMANIGTIYARLGQLDRAMDYQQESLTLKEEAGNTLGIAVGLGNIAALHLARNERDEALGMFELSLQLRREIGDRRGMAVTLRNIGDILSHGDKNDRAMEYFAEALDIARELNLIELQQEVHVSCARLYEALGNTVAALGHLKESVGLRESSMTRKHLKHVAALELEYDREHDRAMSDHLHHQVFDLEHLALRSQINPHFLYNALNSIQFFLTNSDRESAHRYLSKLGRLMRATLEHSREPLVSLSSEIETVQLYLQLEQLRFGDKFFHAIEIDETLVADDILVPPLLLQPFVENAVLHGLLPRHQAGSVRLHINAINTEEMMCVIEDDGIGREESARRRDMQKDAGPKHTSIGMRLISDRLNLLRARTGKPIRMTVHDLREGNAAMGTRVEIVLPMDLSTTDLR